MPAEAGAGPLGRWLAFALLLLTVACLAQGLAAWPAWRTELPLWDLWPYAGPAFDALDPAVILRAHNEHVPATTALALWADRWLVKGTYVLAGGVELGLVAVAAAWASGAAWRQAPAASAERPLGAALWLSTFASIAALQIAAHPFLLNHLLLTALGLGSAALVLTGATPASWQRVLAASLLSVLAAITQANGVILPFVLLMLDGLRRRRLPDPFRALVLVLPALALFLWLHLLRETAPQLTQIPRPTAGQFLDYLLRLAGTAAGLGLHSETASRLAGGLVLLAALPPAAMLLLRPARLLGDPLGAAAATLLIVTASGFLGSAWGRAATTPTTLYVKYGYYSLLFAGVVAYLDARLLPPRWRRLWLFAAVAALLLVNAALLWRAPHIVERQAQQLRAEAAGYVFLLDTPDFCHVAECQPNHLGTLRHWRAHGLNVFAWPEARLLGQPLGGGAAGVLPACDGGVERVAALVADDGTAVLRADGWLAGSLEPRQPLYAVAEGDPQRRVLGFGFASDLASDADGEARQAWRVYLAPGDQGPPLAVLPAQSDPPCRIAIPAPGSG
ncbi:MAG TPA: hypothetical protein VJL84_02060 [Kiloniellales bacterium]|nr:hypothetical protein [Kiloniellales bacterium]